MTDTDRLDTTRHRRATIVDVGKHAGVSTASVSKVLRNAYGVSESMRERVHHSMAELGYRPHRPARGMRGRTYSIGMMVSDVENPFFNLISDGVTSVLRPQSYELLIAPAGYDTEGQTAVVDALIDHQMDGLILVAPLMSKDELDRIAREIPLLVVGLHSVSDSYDSVSGDDALGAALVVDHLVGLGHERIAFVAHSYRSDDAGRPESVRLEGFQAAMERHGLRDQAVVVSVRWSLEGGREAARQLESLAEPPTAVHAGADVVAFGMMSELWERGERVPQSYSLAGYDNSTTSSIGPIDLTTVDQSGRRMGETAGRMLLERIEGRSEAHHELLQPALVPRGTTARLK